LKKKKRAVVLKRRGGRGDGEGFEKKKESSGLEKERSVFWKGDEKMVTWS